MSSDADRIVRSTVQIIAHESDDIFQGSGMLLQLKLDDAGKFAPVVVTNKHVVDGCSSVEFALYPSRTAGQRVKVVVPPSGILYHPDADIDLCLIAFPPEALDSGVHSHEFISSDDILLGNQLAEMTAIEDIYMIGYPNGLIDETKLYPVVRKGITASPVYEDYSGKPHDLSPKWSRI